MSSTSASGGQSSGKAIAIVLAVIAVVCIVVGIIFFVTPAHSLPAFLGQIKFNGHNHARAYASRPLHGAAALVVGVVCLVGAWFAVKRGKTQNSSGSSAPVDVSTRN